MSRLPGDGVRAGDSPEVWTVRSAGRASLVGVEIEHRFREASAQMALLGHMAFFRFTTVPPTHVYAAYRATLDAAIRHAPDRASVIHIAEQTSHKLDRSEMVAEFQKMMREYGDRLQAVGVAILSDGFISSALRAMISTSLVLTRPRARIRVFGDLGDACGFVATHTGDSAGHLTRMAVQFRHESALSV
jgi:hypothetical protein